MIENKRTVKIMKEGIDKMESVIPGIEVPWPSIYYKEQKYVIVKEFLRKLVLNDDAPCNLFRIAKEKDPELVDTPILSTMLANTQWLLVGIVAITIYKKLEGMDE